MKSAYKFKMPVCISFILYILMFLFTSCVSSNQHEYRPLPRLKETTAPAVYGISEIVEFESMIFQIKSAKFSNSFLNWVYQTTQANATFLIVEISYTNKRNKALAYHFRPLFTLYDENGVEYEKSDQATIMINMGRAGYNLTDAINPNVEYTSKIVFDIPKQKYKLRILVPTSAQYSFGDYNKLSGKYFYYDLQTVK
ncbi:MAG: DUF4352 domain-containing protein [Bacilli bacterium]|nr:DUF4352 domain-containing protein [Bacilli bacterium]